MEELLNIQDRDFTAHPNYKRAHEYKIDYDTLDKEKKVLTAYGGESCYSCLRGENDKLKKIKYIKIFVFRNYTLYDLKEIKEYIRNLNKLGIYLPIRATTTEDEKYIYITVVNNPKLLNIVPIRLATLTALRYLWELNSTDFRQIPYYFNIMMKHCHKELTPVDCLCLAHYTTAHNWYASGHCLLTRKGKIFKTKEKILKIKNIFNTLDALYSIEIVNIPKSYGTLKELHNTIQEYQKNK